MTETKNQFYHDILKRITQNPPMIWILIGIAAFGAILLLTGNDHESITSSKQPQDNVSSQYNVNDASVDNGVSVEKRLAGEIEKALESIEGVGSVTVKVNLRSQSRKIWERQIHTNKRSIQEQDGLNTEDDIRDELVFAKGHDGFDRPILKEELAPVIEGVIVVAVGAQDIKLKHVLTETVMTILGIPAHRVMVLPGKSSEF